MKATEYGVLDNSNLYFSSPSQTAKNLYFYPVSAGHYFCNSKYHIIRNEFSSVLVVQVLSGSLSVFAEGNCYVAQKDDTVVIDCAKPHEYFAESYCEFLWVHIDGHDCINFYNEITKKEGNVFKCAEPLHIKKIINRIIDNISKSTSSTELTISLDIYKLLLDLLNPLHISTNNNSTYEQSVRDAKDYIFSNLNTKLNVEDIASNVHLSASHFSRVFKQQTGFSPYDFVLVAKLNKAKDYLQKTDMPISEIAYLVGFGSDTGFITFFKNHTGISPNRFRKLKF